MLYTGRRSSSLQQSGCPSPEHLISKCEVAIVVIASVQRAAGRVRVSMCGNPSSPGQLDGVGVIKSHISQMKTPHETEDYTSVRAESNDCFRRVLQKEWKEERRKGRGSGLQPRPTAASVDLCEIKWARRMAPAAKCLVHRGRSL